jgi:hypothetical protein
MKSKHLEKVLKDIFKKTKHEIEKQKKSKSPDVKKILKELKQEIENAKQKQKKTYKVSPKKEKKSPKKTPTKNRPSPSQHASETPLGKVMIGNDGNNWIVTAISGGVKRWKKV